MAIALTLGAEVTLEWLNSLAAGNFVGLATPNGVSISNTGTYGLHIDDTNSSGAGAYITGTSAIGLAVNQNFVPAPSGATGISLVQQGNGDPIVGMEITGVTTTSINGNGPMTGVWIHQLYHSGVGIKIDGPVSQGLKITNASTGIFVTHSTTGLQVNATPTGTGLLVYNTGITTGGKLISLNYSDYEFLVNGSGLSLINTSDATTPLFKVMNSGSVFITSPSSSTGRSYFTANSQSDFFNLYIGRYNNSTVAVEQSNVTMFSYDDYSSISLMSTITSSNISMATKVLSSAAGSIVLSGGDSVIYASKGTASITLDGTYGDITIVGGSVGHGNITANGSVEGTCLRVGTAAHGGIYADGTIYYHTLTQMSSRTFKHDIKPIVSSIKSGWLDKISKIDLYSFVYNSDKDDIEHIGVIAEESPDEMTNKEKNGFDLGGAVTMLLGAVQVLTDKVTALEARV